MVLLLLGISKTSALPTWVSGVGTISLATEVMETLSVVDIEFTDLGHSIGEFSDTECPSKNPFQFLHR